MANTRNKLDEIVASFSALGGPPLPYQPVAAAAQHPGHRRPRRGRRAHGHRPLGQAQGGSPQGGSREMPQSGRDRPADGRG